MTLALKFICVALASGALSIASETCTKHQESVVRCDAAFEINTYSTDQITPLLPLLEDWVEREFFQYPYLWAPPKGKICFGNSMLVNEKNAQVVIVRKEGQVIGVAAGGAFDSEGFKSYLGQSAVEMTKARGYDPSRVLYMSYFLTASEYRNDERLVSAIYNKFADFARSLGRTHICFYEDFGDPDSPLKPEHPVPIEPWGYVIKGCKSMDIRLDLSWETLQPDGSVIDQSHSAELFIKEI